MGIFLNFTVAPHRINEDEWTQTYEQACQIADKCNLMDHVFDTRDGVKYSFARKTCERDLYGDGPGIKVCGTMDSGYNMESFCLYRNLSHYYTKETENDTGIDILLASWYSQDPDIPSTSFTFELWGGKTQGEAGHLPLLAIACLFADRFPDAVTVGGDITAGQCRAAVRLVKEALGIEIQVPARCQPDLLAKRLLKVGISTSRQLRGFFSLYLGALTPDVGKILRENFSADDLRQYFLEEFVGGHPDARVFSAVLSDYLLLGFDFQVLLQILISDENGCHMSVKEALEKLFSYRIHIPFEDKDCTNPIPSTSVNGEEEAPSSVEGMLGGAIFSFLAGRNKNLPVYIPLENIREVCRSFDHDADALIDSLLAQEDKDERQEEVYGTGENSFMSLLRQKAEQIAEEEQAQEGYDMSSLTDLFCWRPGCTFSPKLENSILTAIRQIQAFELEDDFRIFLSWDRSEREAWFLRQNRYVLFRESFWEHIFSHIMEDDYIRRYFHFFRVDCSRKSASDLIEPLLSNPELVDMLWEKAEKQSV